MGRIVKLTERDLSRIVRRVISEQEVPSQETMDTEMRARELVQKFQGKYLNFYLPGDDTIPFIERFMCKNVDFNDDGTEIYIDGSSKEADMRLIYLCDNTDIFTVKIDRFKNDFWQNFIGGLLDTFDLSVNNKWQQLILGYVGKKSRTMQAVGRDLKMEKKKMYFDIRKKYPRELVEGGVDSKSKEMISYIQEFLCSTNKSGKAVPKATFASMGRGGNTDMA